MLVNQAIMGGNTLGDALTTLWCLSCPSWCWQWWKIWVSLLTWFEVANLLIDQLIHHFTVMRSFHTLLWMLHSLDKTNSSPWLTAGSSYQLAWSSMHHWYIHYLQNGVFKVKHYNKKTLPGQTVNGKDTQLPYKSIDLKLFFGSDRCQNCVWLCTAETNTSISLWSYLSSFVRIRVSTISLDCRLPWLRLGTRVTQQLQHVLSSCSLCKFFVWSTSLSILGPHSDLQYINCFLDAFHHTTLHTKVILQL